MRYTFSGIDYMKILEGSQEKALVGLLLSKMATDSTLTNYEKATTINNVSPMLSAYMQKAAETQVSYTQSAFSSVWLPYFKNMGFGQNLTTSFFRSLRELQAKGLVPRSVWLPPRPTVSADNASGTGFMMNNVRKSFPFVLVGVGAVAIVGLIFVMKK